MCVLVWGCACARGSGLAAPSLEAWPAEQVAHYVSGLTETFGERAESTCPKNQLFSAVAQLLTVQSQQKNSTNSQSPGSKQNTWIFQCPTDQQYPSDTVTVPGETSLEDAYTQCARKNASMAPFNLLTEFSIHSKDLEGDISVKACDASKRKMSEFASTDAFPKKLFKVSVTVCPSLEAWSAEQVAHYVSGRDHDTIGRSAFVAALEPMSRTWAAERTIMLRRTSKMVKEVVENLRLPAVVRLSQSFGKDGRNGTHQERQVFVLTRLEAMTAWCHITTLELTNALSYYRNDGAERLAAVLAQCPALAHLNLSGNGIRRAGAASLAPVLGQCTALTHLNLNRNFIEAAGLARLAGVLGQFSALSFLDLGANNLDFAGAKILAGLLAQCTALTHLSLEDNRIGAAGAARIVRVLAQRPPLVSLDFSLNGLGADMKRRLAAEWRGEADDLVLENDGWSDGDEEEEEEG